jgi:hypothetical protein
LSLIVIDCHLDVFHELFLEVVPATVEGGSSASGEHTPPTVAADTVAADTVAADTVAADAVAHDESASPTIAAAPAASGEPATKQARLV